MREIRLPLTIFAELPGIEAEGDQRKDSLIRMEDGISPVKFVVRTDLDENVIWKHNIPLRLTESFQGNSIINGSANIQNEVYELNIFLVPQL